MITKKLLNIVVDGNSALGPSWPKIVSDYLEKIVSLRMNKDLLSRLSQSSLHFKDFNVFCQDYHSLLYILKTSMSFVKTITVFFTFQRPSESFLKTIRVFFTFPKTVNVFCKDYQSLLYFSKTIKVFCLVEAINVFCSLHFKDHQCLLSRLSESSLNFQRPSMFFVKTIKVFFTFPRLSKSVVLRRLSMSSTFYFSKTIKVFCCQDYQSLLYIFIDYQSLLSSRLSKFQCLLYIAKLQGLLFDVPDAFYILSFDRFHCLGFR
ncbi:hypothetical protein JHK87_000784 [Glycine soja]|nr:hypothetical protein JHK87_000784 [Glycine soja]